MGTTKENQYKIGDWGWNVEPLFKGERVGNNSQLGLEGGSDVLG